MSDEKKSIKAKAKINLKYDRDVIKAGQTFPIRKSDVKELTQSGCVEVIGKMQEDKPTDNNKLEGSSLENDGE